MILTQATTHATADEFVRLDPLGVGMTLIAMLVVISVLAFVATFFQNLERMINFTTKALSKRKEKTEKTDIKVSTSGEEAAAIALALHLFISEQHDSESLNLTLNRISKTYSPWSSKIYGVMNSLTPRK
jgi:Na+-transporting methylmalonyl-CoA/oxaloacetate decarboxylase gamma subunit